MLLIRDKSFNVLVRIIFHEYTTKVKTSSFSLSRDNVAKSNIDIFSIDKNK